MVAFRREKNIENFYKKRKERKTNKTIGIFFIANNVSHPNSYCFFQFRLSFDKSLLSVKQNIFRSSRRFIGGDLRVGVANSFCMFNWIQNSIFADQPKQETKQQTEVGKMKKGKEKIFFSFYYLN